MALVKPLVAWSHSALEVYRTCPRKYYEAKITKQWVEEFKGPAADWGNAVHKALERRIRFGSPLPSNMVQWEPLAAKLAGMKGRIYLEQQLAVNNQHEKVDWFAKDTWCRAIIDLMCINEVKGKAILWDYKTGRKKSNDNQLALMAAVVFDHYPGIHTVIAGYLWLKEPNPVDKSTFVREYKDRLWGQYLPTVAALEQSITSGHWPEKPGGLCNGWCPVQDCQFWQPRKEK